MLVSGNILLNLAEEKEFAIPAFGFVNMEGAMAIVKAAEDCSAPVIMQMTEGGVKYGSLDTLYSIAKSLANKASVPIAIHLDHGQSIGLIKESIDIGFNSVMYDGSKLSIDENCTNSSMVKDYIGDREISFEVEVGVIGGKEDDILAEHTIYADIGDIIKINNFCDPNMIAIAAGTSHGIYVDEVVINYDLIKQAYDLTGKPIVLHGLSGVPGEMITKSIGYGVRKANFDTELKQAYIKGVTEYLAEHPSEYDLRVILKTAIDLQVEVIKERIVQCGANNKAMEVVCQ